VHDIPGVDCIIITRLLIAIILTHYNNRPVSLIITSNMLTGVEPAPETLCVWNIPQTLDTVQHTIRPV
jgi:hypothetical protein